MQSFSLDENDILNGGKIYSNIISTYFSENEDENLEIRDEFRNICFNLFVDHDGFDRDGPESNLYTLLIKWNDKKKRKFAQIWYREYWFQNEDTNKFEKINYLHYNLKDKLNNHTLIN